jgi:2-(1,2-epoxy-1,2-dihydrophenyl)acetyl-CoA isomerase
MADDRILVERRGRVGIITLNRPDKLNSLTHDMSDELRGHIEAWNEDPTIGAIVWTANGRGFCTGADVGSWNTMIAQREAGQESEYLARPRPAEHWSHFIMRSKPVVAAINGLAVGVGLVMTLPCDVRIASDQARFSMRMVRMAIPPEGGSTLLLPHIIGIGQTLELVETARIIDAREAGRIGLVNHVVPHEELLDRALAVANEIAFNPTGAIGQAKQLIWGNYLNPDLKGVLQSEADALAVARELPAFKEAVRAFLEKRDPNFHTV